MIFSDCYCTLQCRCRFVIVERAAPVLPSANQSEMRSFQCSFLILLFSWSVLWVPTHRLLPQSSWIKYTWWCAKKPSFFSFCTPDLRSFIFLQKQTCPCTMTSRSLSRAENRGGGDHRSLMSGTSRAATSALLWLKRWILLILHPPLLVPLSHTGQELRNSRKDSRNVVSVQVLTTGRPWKKVTSR